MHPTPRRAGRPAADANSAACSSPHCIGLRSPTRRNHRGNRTCRATVDAFRHGPRCFSQRLTGMAACLSMERIFRGSHRLPPPRNLSVPTWPMGSVPVHTIRMGAQFLLCQIFGMYSALSCSGHRPLEGFPYWPTMPSANASPTGVGIRCSRPLGCCSRVQRKRC